jgi:hypothetical protein
MTILPVGAQLFHADRADGHTDRTKLIVYFVVFRIRIKTTKTEFSRILTYFFSILKINIDAEASKPSASVRINTKVIIVQ